MIKWAVTDDETKMEMEMDNAKASQTAATAGYSVPKTWDLMCEGLRLHHLASSAQISGDSSEKGNHLQLEERLHLQKKPWESRQRGKYWTVLDCHGSEGHLRVKANRHRLAGVRGHRGDGRGALGAIGGQ